MRLPSKSSLAVIALLSVACTSVPMRDRDASREDATMDASGSADASRPDDVAVVDDVAVNPQPDATASRDGSAPPDVTAIPDAAPMCPAGQSLCGSTCVDTNTSVAHCGGCDAPCAVPPNSTGRCATGRCSFMCRAGFGDCDRVQANGCETSLDTAANCGACGVACSGTTPMCDAMAGRCVSGCTAPLVRCDTSCIDTTNSATNCGSCGNVCPGGANAAPLCAASRCILACNAGFGDCDGNLANGCEANLNSSAANCGRCGMACAGGANATGVCAAGVCNTVCNAGFGDCDGLRGTGCETNTTNNAMNCGGCGRACGAIANGVGFCASSTCQASCNRDFGNCDGAYTNGCEVSLRANPANCLACGVNCGPNGVCMAMGCATCTVPTTACGNTCVNTNNDVNNCGACGYVCPPSPMGLPVSCNAGRCYQGLVGDPRTGDCDRMTGTGYEVNTDSSRTNCGACGTACTPTQQCCNGMCIPQMQICNMI